MTALAQPARPARRRARRAPVIAMFSVYLFLLVWLVLWKLGIPWIGHADDRVLKLVPFVATPDAGASAPLEVIANLVIFVPFGVYLGLLAPAWPWWKAASAVAGASIGFEAAQYLLAIGSSDTTDVIVNTAGGLAGFLLISLARRGLRLRLGARSTVVLMRLCTIGTVVVVLAIAAYGLASPVHFGPPPAMPVHEGGTVILR